MESYRPIKGFGIYFLLMITILVDVLIAILLFAVNSYELSILLKILLIVYNIYQFYYISLYMSLKYIIDDENIYIKSVLNFKNIKIPIKDIEGYTKSQEKLRGVKLSGYGKDNFAIGRSIIKKLGVIRMFVTSNKNVIYLKTNNINYGISPIKVEEFEEKLKNKGINSIIWENELNKHVNLHKDRKFTVLFLLVSSMIAIQTLTPFILYLLNKLPAHMPLVFDTKFNPCKFGTGKQFAFKQCSYGILNMAIFFCMYFAAYFYAKYDKKLAYRFIYISLFITLIFLIMQIRILVTFM